MLEVKTRVMMDVFISVEDLARKTNVEEERWTSWINMGEIAAAVFYPPRSSSGFVAVSLPEVSSFIQRWNSNKEKITFKSGTSPKPERVLLKSRVWQLEIADSQKIVSDEAKT